MSATVVIAGASLGGLRAAEQLRAAGWDGAITVVGAERHMPYNRPPLSKGALHAAGSGSGDELAAAGALPLRPSVAEVDWRLGTTVVAADLDRRTVTLDDGDELHYDGLVAATGLRPRRLPLPDHPARHVLRTVDDASALRARLLPGARVVVVGAGFIGCELATTAVTLGCEVTVVEPFPVPMLLPLGAALGRAIELHHRRHGVAFRLGRTVVALDADGPALHTALDDGSVLTCDVLVEAIGSHPNVEWLDGNGLDLSDGLLCDDAMRVQGRPDVVAVGDVARHPCAALDGRTIRVEHWGVPTDTARRAARALASHLHGTPVPIPRAQQPSFWSDQFDLRIHGLGVTTAAERYAVLEGSLNEVAAGVAVGAYRGGRLVGVVTAGLPPTALRRYRTLLDSAAGAPALSAA